MHLSRIVLLIAALIAQTLAAEITVQTRFSQQQVAMGNPVQYIVEITETSNSSRPELQSISSLPINDTGGLRLQNGRSSSNSSTQIMNGRVVHQVTRSAIMDVVAPGIGACLAQIAWIASCKQISAKINLIASEFIFSSSRQSSNF